MTTPMTVNNTAQLQAEVDQFVTALEAPWRAPLIFQVASTSSRHPDRVTIESDLQSQDITSFLGGQKPGLLRLYFDPRKYKTHPIPQSNTENEPVVLLPPPEEEEESQHDATNMSVKKKIQLSPAPPDFILLKKDLENAALQQNQELGGIQFSLYSNGSSGGNKFTPPTTRLL